MDRLRQAGVSDELARAHADAMHDALRESVATRSDLLALDNKIERLDHKIDLAVRDMTIRQGVIATAIVAILAAITFFA
jgi:hypothetical protein